MRRLEIAQATLAQARASVDAAQAEIQRAIEQMGGGDEDNTILKQAQSALDKAKLDLENTVVQGVLGRYYHRPACRRRASTRVPVRRY